MEGPLPDAGYRCGNLYLAQVAVLEGIAADALDGRWKFNGRQVVTSHKPRIANEVESSPFKQLELWELPDLLVSIKIFIETEVNLFYAAHVDDIVPLRRATYGGGIAETAQGFLHTFVDRFHQTRCKLVLVRCPRLVGLKPAQLLLGHLQLQVGRVGKYAATQLYL